MDKKNFKQKNEGNTKAPNSKGNEVQNAVILYFHDLAYLLVGILLVLLLVFRVVVVSGPSMNQTLVDGDYLLLLSNVFYGTPKQGDIIVASKGNFKNGEPIIKRVIATEGQWVDIDFNAGIVYVSDDPLQLRDHPLDEPYTNTPTNLDERVQFPLQVEEGCLFVMGDNRNSSKDSRSPDIGLIDCREILGKAIFLAFPGNSAGSIVRDYKRIGVVS